MAATCVLSAGYVRPDGTASAGAVEFVATFQPAAGPVHLGWLALALFALSFLL